MGSLNHPHVKRVAIIGAGPAGAIAIDALAQEGAFDTIRVFERRKKPGGCWLPDPPPHVQKLPFLNSIANRTPDPPLPIPPTLPTYTPRTTQYRFSDTSIYPNLETNIDVGAMSFTQEPMSEERSRGVVEKCGGDSPFRDWGVVLKYIEGLVERRGYEELIEYGTTVERVEKVGSEWKVVLRKEVTLEGEKDYWWEEIFDAVVVASGHYTVPYIPHIDGLEEFKEKYTGSVLHSKSWRGVEKYKDKKVIVVGSSISGPDISSGLAPHTQHPLYASLSVHHTEPDTPDAAPGPRYHPYFGSHPFRTPYICRKPPISRVDASNGKRTVYFKDGSSVEEVDYIIFGTGYSWTAPFLSQIPGFEIANNRVRGLWQHVFWMRDPTLAFVGGVAAGFTFKVYEYQAVLLARYLSNRISLPSLSVQQKWEADRIAKKGDGVPFTALFPDFEEYFEIVRKLVGEASEGTGKGKGRELPKFEKSWLQAFESAHLRRIRWWKRVNEAAERELVGTGVGREEGRRLVESNRWREGRNVDGWEKYATD